MTDGGEQAARKMREHYESVWQAEDPWDFENSEFDDARYLRQLKLLEGRRYGRVLEIGCGSGRFTALLAETADQLVALDIAPSAIARAREAVGERTGVEFRVANVMEFESKDEEPWDLIVMSETIYCLGWLYPFFDVGWLVSELYQATKTDGRFLLVNTLGRERDYLLRPWLIRTYRDLFRNVGFRLEKEETFGGNKHGVEYKVLMTLFQKKIEGESDSKA